jgi:hypothetical protein
VAGGKIRGQIRMQTQAITTRICTILLENLSQIDWGTERERGGFQIPGSGKRIGGILATQDGSGFQIVMVEDTHKSGIRDQVLEIGTHTIGMANGGVPRAGDTDNDVGAGGGGVGEDGGCGILIVTLIGRVIGGIIIK